MAFKQSGPGNCCCCPGCEPYRDHFSANSIARYDQRAGTWSVNLTAQGYNEGDEWGNYHAGDTGRLETSSTDSRLVCTTYIDADEQAAIVWLLVSASLTGTADYRLLIRWRDDANYLFAKVHVRRLDADSAGATLSVWERRGGVETCLDATPTEVIYYLYGIDQWTSLWLGYADGALVGHLGSSTPEMSIPGTRWSRVAVATPADFGRKAGLAVATSEPSRVAFDEFALRSQVHDCNSGSSNLCHPESWPRTLQIAITGVTGADAGYWNGTFLCGSLRPADQHGWRYTVYQAFPKYLLLDAHLTPSGPDAKHLLLRLVPSEANVTNGSWILLAFGDVERDAPCKMIDCLGDLHDLAVVFVPQQAGSSDWHAARAVVTAIY